MKDLGMSNPDLVSSGSNDIRHESDINAIHQIEQSVREIRQIELLFHQPDLSSESESSNMSENEVCRRVIPHNDMDLSDQEGFMSEDSGSE